MKKKAILHPFLKMAGVKSEKELYDKYPSDEDFFAAHPQAKYGMMMAQDGAMTLPNAKPNVAWQPSGQGLSPADNVAGLNAAGPMPQQGGYQAAQGPVFEGQMPEQEQQKQEQPEGKENKKGNNKNKLKISAGKKTWDPFAKDNAWNTGKGVATTDVIAGGLAMTAGAMPFQPAKKNQNILPSAVTTGNYGYGSQASFEDGGNISPTKAREMLHNPPHGQPLSEKQRKYFGAIASGYAADGGPMITNVPPSPYTYYRPMTKTNRQKMDMPDYMPGQSTPDLPFAANGINIPGVGNYQAPVTDQERGQWNQYQSTMSHQPGTYVRNWQHNQDFQKQMAQQTGFDYNRAGAIQADMQARSQQYPGSVSGIKPGATENQNWGGDANWVGDRERQKAYGKYEYLQYDPKGNLYPGEAGHKEASFTPMTKEQMGNWENSAYTKGPNQWVTNNQGIGMNAPQSEIDKLYQPGAQGSAPSAGGFGSNTPVASSTQPRAKAFPTMDQAKAAYAKKKAGIETKWNATSGEYEEVGKGSTATANTDNSGPSQEAYSVDATRRTGKGSDEAKYGKQMIPGMYHPDHDMEMLDQYPHKMGGMYKPYSHTYTMAQGGNIPMGEQGLQVEGDQFKYLSPQTIELVGPKHENGGIDIAYNGNKVEAEGGETFHVDNKGIGSEGNMAQSGAAMNAGIVGGNLYITDTLKDQYGIKGNMKYKDFLSDVVAKDERKIDRQKTKVTNLSKNLQQDNKYEAPLAGTLRAQADMIAINTAKTEAKKKAATDEQNLQLETAQSLGIEPKELNKVIRSTKWGGKLLNMAKQGMGTQQNDPNAEMAKYGMHMEDGGDPAVLAEQQKLMKEKDYNAALDEYAKTSGLSRLGVAKKFDDGKEGPRTQAVRNYIATTNANKLNYRLPSDQYDPNMDTGIIGEQPKSTPYEFDPSKSGVIPEPKHPDWAYKPDGSKMTPEEMQKNLINRKKPEGKGKGKGIREKHVINPNAIRDIFEQADPYQSMQVQPYLEPEYNVSFQQKKNTIQSAFAPAMKATKTSGQQAAIAAQMAEQLGAVDSEEFNFNQQNRGQILGRNLGEMRGVRDTNMKLGMDAYEKGLGAKEAARQIRRHGGEKVFSDWRTVDAENKRLGTYEDFAGWFQDPATRDYIRTLPPEKLTEAIASIVDPNKKEIVTSTEEDGPKGKKKKVQTKQEEAYFGTYFPGIQRTYFGGGAVGGGMGHSGGGMHGMPGHTGSMASRYSPGGDASYYEKKKKKKKTT